MLPISDAPFDTSDEIFELSLAINHSKEQAFGNLSLPKRAYAVLKKIPNQKSKRKQIFSGGGLY